MMIAGRQLRALILAAACAAMARATRAQGPTATPPRADTSVSLPDARLFHGSDLYVAGAFVAGTIAMFPLDRHLASVIRDEDLIANRKVKSLADVFQFFGGPGPYLIGGSMYVIGRVGHLGRTAELGLHGTEALVVGAAVSGVLKTLLGRQRPYASADTNPRSFALGRGARSPEFQSFPSGHTTTAFAAAAAVSAETAHWWPKTKWIIGPVLYGGATFVGLSRIYHDRHWASDVVMGAAVGTFAGLKTVRFNHTHSGNRLDRWFLGNDDSEAHLRLNLGPDGSVGLMTTWQW